jgi:small subunit ribosomal protein S16
MVKIRLRRIGKKKQPTYRVVVADARAPRDGRFIEAIGKYAPRNEPSVVEIDREKALEWLGKGAQPTEAVSKLFSIAGVTPVAAVTAKAAPTPKKAGKATAKSAG